MTRLAVRINAIVLLAIAIAACASAKSHFYTLEPTATPQTATSAHEAVMVNPVSIPAEVDQPQFVVQVAPNRVEVDDYNRWAAPLSDSIARAIAGDLAADLGTHNVVTQPAVNFIPVYQVTVNVQRFESIKGEASVVEAVWSVHKTVGGYTKTGHTVAREALQSDGFDALPAAHSRALAKVSDDIAAVIRIDADAQPQ